MHIAQRYIPRQIRKSWMHVTRRNDGRRDLSPIPSVPWAARAWETAWSASWAKPFASSIR